MSTYPPKISERALAPSNWGEVARENAAGRDASFVCGSFIHFSLYVDVDSKAVRDASFRTNGCGYMVAAADVLCDVVRGKSLGDLHGLDPSELGAEIDARLGTFGVDRGHCAGCCISALRLGFANHRSRLIEEFRGENALVCTCFGVGEEDIERQIARGAATTIDDVACLTNAGTGCGSCRMLIQEMIDLAGR